MNINHLNQIISNYLNRFEEINGPEHMEYYKWQVAYKFRPLMDEALNSRVEDFPEKLKQVKNTTYNLIDSYTQPFFGLVQFAEQGYAAAEEVQSMFKDLFNAAESNADNKIKAIQEFLDRSHKLRDTLTPGSYRYNDDFHSVTAYLFLYDPDHNYLYKASHCRAFADCIEFYDDWGSGENTKLDVFFRMCDEVLPYLKKDEALMRSDGSRFEIDPNGMHKDTEKHILLFDLIYCCTSYGLFEGIKYNVPNSAERKLIEERKKKARVLSAKLAAAQERKAMLDDAERWVEEAFAPGMTVIHKVFGEGKVLELKGEHVRISFESGEKIFGAKDLVYRGLSIFNDKTKQIESEKYLDVFKNAKAIEDEVARIETELAPYAEYLE